MTSPGNAADLEAPKAGKLCLTMNDHARDDNQGTLSVSISAPRPSRPKQ